MRRSVVDERENAQHNNTEGDRAPKETELAQGPAGDSEHHDHGGDLEHRIEVQFRFR